MGSVLFAVAGNREAFREQALALACAWGRGLKVVVMVVVWMSLIGGGGYFFLWMLVPGKVEATDSEIRVGGLGWQGRGGRRTGVVIQRRLVDVKRSVRGILDRGGKSQDDDGMVDLAKLKYGVF